MYEIVYYTDNRLDDNIMKVCQRQLLKASGDCRIISVSLSSMDFGENYVLDGERGYLTMFKQILTGLELCKSDYVFLCEHDVLYHKSHFDTRASSSNIFHYNQNTWKLDSETGTALFYYCDQVLGLSSSKDLLLEHYSKRVERVEREGFSYKIGFEPGNHPYPRGIDFNKAENGWSEYPNVDIRHGLNLTKSRWSQNQFRDKRSCLGWKMDDEIPGWGITKNRFLEFLKEIDNGNSL